MQKINKFKTKPLCVWFYLCKILSFHLSTYLPTHPTIMYSHTRKLNHQNVNDGYQSGMIAVYILLVFTFMCCLTFLHCLHYLDFFNLPRKTKSISILKIKCLGRTPSWLSRVIKISNLLTNQTPINERNQFSTY